MRGYSASPAPLSAPESATAAAAAHVPAGLHGGSDGSFHEGFRDVMNVRVRRGHAPQRGRPGPGMLLRGTTTAR